LPEGISLLCRLPRTCRQVAGRLRSYLAPGTSF